jgi:hypothetical protein
MLETAHRTIRLRSEDSIHLEPLAWSPDRLRN